MTEKRKSNSIKIRTVILLGLLCVILLFQIPFIYDHYEFGKAKEQIDLLQTRRAAPENSDYRKFQGIIHAHTFLGGHSTGTFAELIAAAEADNLDFVVMTEHTDRLYDTAALTLHGVYGNTLFVGGQEVPTATDRFLQLPGDAQTPGAEQMQTPDYLRRVHEQHRLAIVAYPEKLKTQNADFDGIEVFNLHTNAARMPKVQTFFDALWSYHSYPELVIAKYFARPADNLALFDRLSQTRKLTLTAGTDAHSNIGFHLFGDDAGNKILNLKIDPYETIFRLVRNHVLLEKNQPLSESSLLDAVRNGHLFIGVDVFSDTAGFTFKADNGRDAKIMGDRIALLEGVNLKVHASLPGRIVIFRNGEIVSEIDDKNEASFQAQSAGVYRVEVYLDRLGEPYNRMPWIISNPIYIDKE